MRFLKAVDRANLAVWEQESPGRRARDVEQHRKFAFISSISGRSTPRRTDLPTTARSPEPEP
jgi:hypothetical protein